MAKGENKRYETSAIWEYVDNLRQKAGFKSEGEFATAAGFLPSSLSDWKRGKHVLSSYSLVRLLTAAAERLATAPVEAGEAVSPVVALLRRLEALEAAVAESADKTAESLERLVEGIARIEERRPAEDDQARKAAAR